MRCSPLCWTLTFPVLRSPATYGRIGCCGTPRSAITAGGSLRIINRRSRSPCSLWTRRTTRKTYLRASVVMRSITGLVLVSCQTVLR